MSLTKANESNRTPSTSFQLPITQVSYDEARKGSRPFVPSSRIAGMLEGKKSAGASCNVYEMEDSLESIAEGVSWAIHVLGYQGAPTVYLGNLRPEGTPISTGGTSSGALSFALPIDKHFATMRRTEKKNGAGQLIMPWNYPDRSELVRFLKHPFDAAYRAVYVPMHDTQEAQEFLADTEIIKLLAAYYDNFSTFLVKRPSHEELLTNLCTEVEIPHRGTCVLGAVNLSALPIEDFVVQFPMIMMDASSQMYAFMNLSNDYTKGTPIYCNDPLNRQFGLGLFGLASFLGASGITYRELADALYDNLCHCGGAFAKIHEVSEYSDAVAGRSLAHMVVAGLARGYALATKNVKGYVRAAFCFQPTVSTAHRSFDHFGYHSSPELQPVVGLKHDDAVSTILKSAQKGDRNIDYHPRTWTVYDVGYGDYRDLSGAFQLLINSTGLAHRHSHCYYGERFTPDTLRSWYGDEPFKHIRSLYYRLKFANQESLRKDELWQSTNGINDEDFNVDTFLSGLEQSEHQQPGQITCDCEG